MTLQGFLLERTQPGYSLQVGLIAERWNAILEDGDALVAGEPAAFPNRVAQRLAGGSMRPEVRLQIIADLFSLAWWCGFAIDGPTYAAFGDFIRQQFSSEMRALRVPEPPTRRPDVHAVFTGALESPRHSPSRGTVDYVLALAADPGVARIDLYYPGELTPAMLASLQDRLGGLGERLHLISLEHPDAIEAAVSRGPYCYHFWCERPLSFHVSLLAAFGPTIMFTCGDEPPFQYADVYWYFHEPQYVAHAWTTRGVPASFTANYRPCEHGPNPSLRPGLPRSRDELGLTPDQVVIATVGNRLAIDMDREFVTGMEATLRACPAAHWMVVGALPDYLSSACRQVLGPRFSHIPFEPRLDELMGAVDIFANPFRRGGGDSAMTAITSGAVVLTRGDMGDVRGFVPDAHRARGAEDFFARLGELTRDPALRRAWRAQQQAKAVKLVDQAGFTADLRAMTEAAFRRYQARAGQSLATIFALAPSSRAA